MKTELHLLPLAEGDVAEARITIAETLSIDIGTRCLSFVDADDGLFVLDDHGRRDVTGNIVGEASKLTGMDSELLDAVVGRWLAARHGGDSLTALARRLEVLLPGLARLHQHHTRLAVRTRYTTREIAYLRASSLSAAATTYWGDRCGDAAGRALRDAAAVRDTASASTVRLSEDRIGLLHLIHDPALRGDVATAPTARALVVPHPASRVVTELLSARAQVDFVVEALTRRDSRQCIHVAHRLGIQAKGSNGRDAFLRLASQVRSAGYQRPARVIDSFAATPIDGRTIQVIDTANDTRQLGRTVSNCLRNDHHGWPRNVEAGRVQLAALYNGDDVEAILALSADGSNGLELRGPRNGAVAPDLIEAIRARLCEVTGKDYPMPAHLYIDAEEPF